MKRLAVFLVSTALTVSASRGVPAQILGAQQRSSDQAPSGAPSQTIKQTPAPPHP
jgi:hypothetical protein